MPAKAFDQRAWQGVERADEESVEDRTLPAFVQPRRHWEALEDDLHLAEALEQLAKLADAVLQQHRRTLVLETDLHQFRQGIQPRNAVVDLEDGLATGLQHAPYFIGQPLWIGGVLHDAVREDHVEAVVRERQRLTIRNAQVGGQPLLLEVGARQIDGGRREIDTRADSAALRKKRQVDTGAAADVEYGLAARAVEVDQPEQVMQLLEVILVEIVEESA